MWRTESHVLYVYYTDMHERVWIHSHTRIKSDGKRRRICTTYPFATYITIPSPYTARLSRCLLGRTEIKSLELRPEGGRLLPNLVSMLEQNNDVKGYFFRAGQCAALSSLRVWKIQLEQKRVSFSGPDGKNHSMFRVVTHCLGAFRRLFCSSIGTKLGAKHQPRPQIHTHTGNWGLY